MPDQDDQSSSGGNGDTDGASGGDGGSVLDEPGAEYEYTENAEDDADENAMSEPEKSK